MAVKETEVVIKWQLRNKITAMAMRETKKNTFSWQITQAYIFHGNEGRAIAFDGNEQIHSKPNHTTLPLEDDGST
jgi:hypothetical protein